MTKKVRGTSATYRPGGMGPTRTTKGTSTSATSGIGLLAPDPATDIDAAVDAVSVREEDITIADSALPASAARRSRRAGKVKADSLEARAAAEDTYVREDLRSIAMITGILVVGLLVAWVLLVPLNLAGLY